jgi:hypothetical protein
VPDTPERLGVLENRMNRVEEGIANFREFQKEGREFFNRADERALTEREYADDRAKEIKQALDRRDRNWNFRLMVIGIIISIFMLWLTYRDFQRKISDRSAPVGVSYPQNVPQDSAAPYAPEGK